MIYRFTHYQKIENTTYSLAYFLPIACNCNTIKHQVDTRSVVATLSMLHTMPHEVRIFILVNFLRNYNRALCCYILFLLEKINTGVLILSIWRWKMVTYRTYLESNRSKLVLNTTLHMQ